MIRRLSFALLLVLSVTLGVPTRPAQAASCQIVLGFKTLHDLIPQVVGDCLENEHHNPVNGDGLQMTTNGLLAWRKADNFTAFTDGFRTWVNGPFGLQMRLNSQRFSWEQDPDHLPIVPPPTPGDRCHTAALSVSTGRGDVATGQITLPVILTNNLTVSCTFFGFPGVQFLDAGENPVPTQAQRSGPAPASVTVPPGGSATFMLHWGHNPQIIPPPCFQTGFIDVTPPDERDPLLVPWQDALCQGGLAFVGAMQPSP